MKTTSEVDRPMNNLRAFSAPDASVPKSSRWVFTVKQAPPCRELGPKGHSPSVWLPTVGSGELLTGGPLLTRDSETFRRNNQGCERNPMGSSRTLDSRFRTRDIRRRKEIAELPGKPSKMRWVRSTTSRPVELTSVSLDFVDQNQAPREGFEPSTRRLTGEWRGPLETLRTTAFSSVWTLRCRIASVKNRCVKTTGFVEFPKRCVEYCGTRMHGEWDQGNDGLIDSRSVTPGQFTSRTAPPCSLPPLDPCLVGLL